MGESTCPICKGSGWLCEDHPTQPWQHDGCGAAGVACACNPNAEVQFATVYADNREPPKDLQ